MSPCDNDVGEAAKLRCKIAAISVSQVSLRRRRFQLKQSTAAIVLMSARLVQPAAAYDFSALTTLAEGALQGENVDQPIPV